MSASKNASSPRKFEGGQPGCATPGGLPNRIPISYRLFFLYIEPLSALVGAYYAHFQPSAYLHLTHASSFPSPTFTPSTGTTAVLSQLANLYLLFAINEGLVLRSTTDRKVWRTLLFGLLVADLGHLWSVKGTGTSWEVYCKFWEWNEMAWGNVGFVYAGALTRVLFLLGVGLS
ncbi:hypothetical protein P7C70_g6779, partial [Phenoliferia sp. Uapishka_3]